MINGVNDVSENNLSSWKINQVCRSTN